MEIQWSLVLFTVLSGAGAWLFACIGIDEFKGLTKKVAFPGSLIAVVLLALGGIASVTHLSHPERMMAALGHPAPGIFMEALLLGILAAVAVVYAILAKREGSRGARKVLAVIGIVIAVVFSFSCGSSYMMVSQEMWNTITLPLGFLGTAAACGTSFYLCLCAAMKEEAEAIRFAGIETVVGGVLALVLALAYGFMSGIAMGGQAALFWGAVILCGGAAPLVFGLLASRKPESALPYAIVAVVGALIGAAAYRALMWIVGSALMTLFGVML